MHLNENVLLVGSGRVVGALNQLQAPFDNFHGLRIDYPRCHDYRLKQFIQGNQLNSILGGFMTDIPENDAGAYATFLEQLAILDADHFQMISFGDIPFHTLEANLLPAQINDLPHGIRAFQSALILNNRNCFIDIYRVWHYALWGRYQHYIVQLEEQLQYINDLLA